jgi:hypothetical protein
MSLAAGDRIAPDLNAPVLAVLSTPAVLAILQSDGATRIYDFQTAPQGTPTPYLTWFTVVGLPGEGLSRAPDYDVDTIQIDMYASAQGNGRAAAKALALAVRDALDAARIVNRRIVDTSTDTDTKFFRISFEADFIFKRG